MLDQLLEADLDVLEGTGDSDVAHHVRDCARCQAIARQIVGDTRSLAVAVADTRTVTTILPITAAPSVARRRSHSRLAIVAGVAAALGGMVVAREWPHRAPIAVRLPPRVATLEPQPPDTLDLAKAPARVIASRPAPPRRAIPAPRPRATAGAREAESLLASGASQVAATVAERTIAKPIAQPSAVVAVRMDTTTDGALGGTIAVEPPTGVRANIIRTPNPSVTVVWLYQ
jgi:hypothetical protein